jgi:hypothetical protein
MFGNGKLRNPNTANKFVLFLNNIIKDQIQKDKQLYPHEFVALPLHKEHPDLGV